jgi:hypothetical protein
MALKHILLISGLLHKQNGLSLFQRFQLLCEFSIHRCRVTDLLFDHLLLNFISIEFYTPFHRH